MRTEKEVRDEITVLNQNISKFNKMKAGGYLARDDLKDLEEFVQWRDALSWVLTEVPK